MFVAMVLLGVVSIITLISARTTLLELVMAGNEQKRISAFEKAEAGLHALYHLRESSIDFNLPLNSYDCTTNVGNDTTCNRSNVSLPSGAFGNNSSATVKRVGEAAFVCPPAYLEISCTDAKAAFFELRSQYDGRANGDGNVMLTQGMLSILPDQE